MHAPPQTAKQFFSLPVFCLKSNRFIVSFFSHLFAFPCRKTDRDLSSHLLSSRIAQNAHMYIHADGTPANTTISASPVLPLPAISSVSPSSCYHTISAPLFLHLFPANVRAQLPTIFCSSHSLFIPFRLSRLALHASASAQKGKRNEKRKRYDRGGEKKEEHTQPLQRLCRASRYYYPCFSVKSPPIPSTRLNVCRRLATWFRSPTANKNRGISWQKVEEEGERKTATKQMSVWLAGQNGRECRSLYLNWGEKAGREPGRIPPPTTPSRRVYITKKAVFIV